MRVRLKHRNLAPGHLSRLVNGKRLDPGVETREKLLKGLDVQFEDLFEVETKRPRGDRPYGGHLRHGYRIHQGGDS